MNGYSRDVVADRVIYQRIKREWSQEELGLRTDRSRKTVNNWETRKSDIPLPDLVKLAEIFCCDVGYLLGMQDDERIATTDIREKTGLSKFAAEKLQDIHSGIVPELNKVAISVISDMLEDDIFLEEVSRLKNDIDSIPKQSISCMLHYLSTSSYEDMGFRPISAKRLKQLLLSELQQTIYEFLTDHYFRYKEDEQWHR
ncbi:MAG: helix-turn-helix domain-containing protein [Faecousia sp.]